MSAPLLWPVPARPVPVRKRKRAKIDTGLRPDGAIYGPAYWKNLPREPGDLNYMFVPVALRNPKFGFADAEVLCFSRLILHGGKTDECIVGQDTLGAEIHRSTRSTWTYLTNFQKKGWIEPHHRKHPVTGGQTSNQYFPIWNQAWEDDWRANHGSASGRQIGERFDWSLFRRERFTALLIPLEIAGDAHPTAALYYGELLEKQTPSQWTIKSTNSKLAEASQIARRLERDDSRRERHDAGGKRKNRKPEKTADRKPFQHYPGRRVSQLNRHLKRWVRVEPGRDPSGRRSANVISLLKSQTDTRRSPKKWPKR